MTQAAIATSVFLIDNKLQARVIPDSVVYLETTLFDISSYKDHHVFSLKDLDNVKFLISFNPDHEAVNIMSAIHLKSEKTGVAKTFTFADINGPAKDPNTMQSIYTLRYYSEYKSMGILIKVPAAYLGLIE